MTLRHTHLRTLPVHSYAVESSFPDRLPSEQAIQRDVLELLSPTILVDTEFLKCYMVKAADLAFGSFRETLQKLGYAFDRNLAWQALTTLQSTPS